MKRNLTPFLLIMAVGCSLGCGKPTQAQAARSTPSSQTQPKASTPNPSPSASESSDSESEREISKGDRFADEECGVELTIPSGWTQTNTNGSVAAASPDESVGVMFVPVGEDDLETACKEVDKLLAEIITDIQDSGEPTEGEINGMKCITVEGTGKSEGKDVVWSVDLVKSKKILMIVAAGEKEGLAKNSRDLNKLVDSIQPL